MKWIVVDRFDDEYPVEADDFYIDGRGALVFTNKVLRTERDGEEEEYTWTDEQRIRALNVHEWREVALAVQEAEVPAEVASKPTDELQATLDLASA